MTVLSITEAVSVPFPMVRHAAGIGWTPLTPQAAMQKRGGEAGMLRREIDGNREMLASDLKCGGSPQAADAVPVEE